MKSKGFTLVEIIAVVTLLGILAVIATTSVFKYIESSRESAKQTTLKDVEDATVSYGLTIFIPNSCATPTKVTKKEQLPSSTGCSYTIKIQDLINKNFLKDESQILDREAEVYIYKLETKTSKTSYEIKAFVPETIIKKK